MGPRGSGLVGLGLEIRCPPLAAPLPPHRHRYLAATAATRPPLAPPTGSAHLSPVVPTFPTCRASATAHRRSHRLSTALRTPLLAPHAPPSLQLNWHPVPPLLAPAPQRAVPLSPPPLPPPVHTPRTATYCTLRSLCACRSLQGPTTGFPVPASLLLLLLQMSAAVWCRWGPGAKGPTQTRPRSNPRGEGGREGGSWGQRTQVLGLEVLPARHVLTPCASNPTLANLQHRATRLLLLLLLLVSAPPPGGSAGRVAPGAKGPTSWAQQA